MGRVNMDVGSIACGHSAGKVRARMWAGYGQDAGRVQVGQECGQNVDRMRAGCGQECEQCAGTDQWCPAASQ